MKFKIFLIVVFICGIVLYGQAQEGEDIQEFPEQPSLKKVGQAGYTFLKIGVDARSTAMGEAGVTLEGEASNIFFNPAGITAISDNSVFVGYTTWIADIQKSAVAGVKNLGSWGYVGLSAIYMDYNTIEGTEIDPFSPLGYKDIGNIDVQEYAIGLTYGRRFTDRFGFAATARFCYQDLVVDQSQIVAFDVGTIYHIGWHGVKVGMSIQHFATDMEYVDESFRLPLTFHIGASADILSFTHFDSEEHDLDLVLEGNNPIDYSERFHIGTEYWFRQMFALRAGYKFNYDEENLSLGAGLRYKGIHFDYSYASFGEFLGSVNRFSMHMTF